MGLDGMNISRWKEVYIHYSTLLMVLIKVLYDLWLLSMTSPNVLINLFSMNPFKIICIIFLEGGVWRKAEEVGGGGAAAMCTNSMTKARRGGAKKSKHPSHSATNCHISKHCVSTPTNTCNFLKSNFINSRCSDRINPFYLSSMNRVKNYMWWHVAWGGAAAAS